ncbi:hypothetical protein D5086_033705 [Populus alba]|uniref:Uncharacterized protein n=1 Tax=Populus alba TaxID=43335 RepID=A0ACC4AHJ4_POPAL
MLTLPYALCIPDDKSLVERYLCNAMSLTQKEIKAKSIRPELKSVILPCGYKKFNPKVLAAELVSDCLKCCTEDSDDSISKITYSGAIIEVCMRKLVFYPEIVGFIEEEKDQFPTVKVQYLFNSPPKLIMLDDEGQHKETIRIDNWKREHMLQFLQGKVKPTSAI